MTTGDLDAVLAGAAPTRVIDLRPAAPPPSVLAARADEAGWDAFVVDGRTVHDKASALAAVAEAGEFPDWFGHNLDALADCLGDLSWRPGARHALVWSRSDRLWLLDDADRDGLRSVLDDVCASGRLVVALA